MNELRARLSRCAVPMMLCLVIAGCTAPQRLTVSDRNAVRPTYQNGVPLLISEKRATVLVRLLSAEFSEEIAELPTFYIAMANNTSEPIDFSTANVTATWGAKRIKVFRAEDIQAMIRREATWEAVAVALNGASQSMNAAQPQQSYSSGTASAYGTGGYAYGNYSGTTTTYNPAATAAAQAQINANTQRQMDMIAGARDAQLTNLNGMLRRETVMPGQTVGGAVKVTGNLSAKQPLLLSVNVAGDIHEFVFEVTK